MKIAVDMGHCLSGADTSAEDIMSESACDREIGHALISKLEALGHEVINVTVDHANSVMESLQARVEKANANNVDFYISIHLNCGGGIGSEVWITGEGGQAEKVAHRVQDEMVKLGYRDRGVKNGRLYVTKCTNASAILVECGFVDSHTDCSLYNADKIANAICKGVVGQTTNVSSSVPHKEENVNDTICIGTVTASCLNVRESNSTDSEVIGTLSNGETIRVSKNNSKGDWYSIYYGNHGGWVYAKYVDCPQMKEPVVEILNGTVTASCLNVRNGASVGSEIIGALEKGTRVKIGVQYSKGDWYSIYFGNHGGFVHKNYIKLD